MPVSSSFLTAYAALNAEQKLAVDTLEGPVMVVAGPGTGKTQILATRIANILSKTDTNPSSILALTFTESGAAAMRKRLISLIGQTGYYVYISTFHAFCADVISDHPEYFPLPPDAQALSELERYEIFSTIIANNELEILKPLNAPDYYVKAIIKSISDLKREGITPDQLQEIIDQEVRENNTVELKKTARLLKEKNISKHRDLLIIYRQYQDTLSKVGRFDFDDMIMLVSHAFQTEELLLATYQEKFHFILIDEYQDTNGAQFHVINLLSSFWGESANLFVVGDINQSIYRFQGASAENVLNFIKQYPAATVVHLEQNYRSTQTILDAAQSLILHNNIRLDTLTGHAHTLLSQKGEGTPLSLIRPSSGQLEVVFVAEKIKELLDAKVDPSSIAVIYRHNNDSIAISSALAKWGILYEIDGGVNILTTPIIGQLLLLLRVISGLKTGIEDMDLFTLLNFEWTGLDPLAILKLTRKAATQHTQILDVILENVPAVVPGDSSAPESTGDVQEVTLVLNPPANDENQSSSETPSVGIPIDAYLPASFVCNADPAIAAIQRFVLKLVALLNAETNHTFVTWFESVLQSSGFLPFVLQRQSVVEDLNRVNTLFNEIKRLANLDHTLNLDRFLRVIETLNAHDLSITEEDQNIQHHAVHLTTAHKSKGQEWEYVFILTAIDKKWGNNSTRNLLPLPESIITSMDISSKDPNEDERRLFYVALTRAKSSVTLSIPSTLISGDSSKETVPSIFTTEINPTYLQDVSLEQFESSPAALLEKLVSPRPPVVRTNQEEEFLSDLVARFKLSPTALNTYLQCPYKFKLNHLLKVPRAQSEHQALGTAIHKALELFFLKLQADKLTPSVDFLLESFNSALQNELLTPEAEKKRRRHGELILQSYYQSNLDQFTVPLFCERQFGSGWSKTYLDDIPLTGKVDRIDWLSESDKIVRIIDYKTGRLRTRNEIEGKTGKKDPAYKRQLVFYKLLTELDKTFTPTAENFVLDFIEPDKTSGKHKQESFSISREEVEELKTTIRTVMQEIRALKFDHTPNTAACSECEFFSHCWPEGIAD